MEWTDFKQSVAEVLELDAAFKNRLANMREITAAVESRIEAERETKATRMNYLKARLDDPTILSAVRQMCADELARLETFEATTTPDEVAIFCEVMEESEEVFRAIRQKLTETVETRKELEERIAEMRKQTTGKIDLEMLRRRLEEEKTKFSKYYR